MDVGKTIEPISEDFGFTNLKHDRIVACGLHVVKVFLSSAAVALEKTSDDFRFSAAVAAFGMVLRDSEFKGAADLAQALDLAKGGAARTPSATGLS